MADLIERPWRCDVTGNPVGTDTRMIGAPDCDCQGCRAAAALETAEREIEENDKTLDDIQAKLESNWNGRVLAEASLSQALARIEELEKALRELVIRTENFWALIQGEYGVCLSYDQDHNVTGFFSALDDANAALCPATPIDGGKR